MISSVCFLVEEVFPLFLDRHMTLSGADSGARPTQAWRSGMSMQIWVCCDDVSYHHTTSLYHCDDHTYPQDMLLPFPQGEVDQFSSMYRSRVGMKITPSAAPPLLMLDVSCINPI